MYNIKNVQREWKYKWETLTFYCLNLVGIFFSLGLLNFLEEWVDITSENYIVL